MKTSELQLHPTSRSGNFVPSILLLFVAAAGALDGLVLFFFDPIHFELLQRGLADDLLRPKLVPMLAGLCACIAGIVVATAALFAPSERAPRRVKLARTRGAVITEMLIVLPVYLLLVFGLAQLTLNSVASLLATLASYESARTLAVWGPEADIRRDVTTEIAIEKARIAAANVLAPVVPAVSAIDCVTSEAFDLQRRGLEGVGHREPLAARRDDSLASALDNVPLYERGLPKLKNAYCSTQVRVDGGAVVPGERFVARLEFEHANVVPLVGSVFADRYVPGVGWVQTVRRSYEGTAQLQPNPIDPACRFCPEWGNSIF